MIDQEEREGLIEDLSAEIRGNELEIVRLTNEYHDCQNKLHSLQEHIAVLLKERQSINGKLQHMRDKLKDLQDEL